MKHMAKFWGIAIKTSIILSLAGCTTSVPVKSVRMPTINGMETVKYLGIENFRNRSGVGGPLSAQITQYLTDKAKSMIPATGKFHIVAPTDPNADGVFFGELRSIASEDSRSESQGKDSKGNAVIVITYTRKVSVAFVYGVRSSRTGMELGTVSKRDSTSVSTTESPADLTDPLVLAMGIVDSEMRNLVQDIVPTIVSTNRTLMNETSKDKEVKQLMKAALALVKTGEYREAARQYDQIAAEYGSVAARTNAGILRQSIESEAAASAKMAQLDSERNGLIGRAVKNAVDSLNSKLPPNTNIMIIKTNSMEPNLLNDVVDKITEAIVQAGQLRVVDRLNQDLINAEQQFQLSGDVDDASAVSIGHQLGARYAVLCWISGVSSGRKLNVRVLDIETAQITDQSNFDI